MARRLPAVAFFALLALPALSSACGGGGPSIDIRDFDTARFTMTQTSTGGGDTSQVTGEGVIDNRRQAVSVTLEGESVPTTIAIGRTIYSYNEGDQTWEAFTEEAVGEVGFGRPYWPQFWRGAVQIQNLGGQSLASAETTHYLLTFDPEKVREWLQPGGPGEQGDALDVRQPEVEVWVDEDSRYAVQLTSRVELVLAGQTTEVEVTSSFSDFGTEVQIEAPEVASPTPAATEPAPTESGSAEPAATPGGP